ncbi:MAG TPA: DUF819 family protein [Prolixibacteraceae bacterium]|nr:DUF819 family protein [Prolixibacteraceae bacterium]HPS13314.1 DUF819 family protein [Prolixibacteraceae bacterium]
MITIALFLFYSLTPLLIWYLCENSKFFHKLGAVVIIYLIGILVANLFLFPMESDAFRNLLAGRAFVPKADALELLDQGVIKHNDMVMNQIASFQNSILSYIIPIAIPFLLLSFNIKDRSKLLGKGMSSIILTISLLFICLSGCFFLFKNFVADVWNVSGTIVGLFSGGTAGLATISTALGTTPAVFVIIQLFGLIISIGLFIFFITKGKHAFDAPLLANESEIETPLLVQEETISNPTSKKQWKSALALAGLLGISIFIFAISYFASKLVPFEYQKPTTILLVLILGMLIRFIEPLKKIERTADAGSYFLLLFCLIISSMFDFRTFVQPGMISLLLLIIFSVGAAISLTILLSKPFGIHKQTTLISLVSLIMPSHMVTNLANVLKKNEIIPIANTIGSLGFLISSFGGIFLAYILKILQ